MRRQVRPDQQPREASHRKLELPPIVAVMEPPSARHSRPPRAIGWSELSYGEQQRLPLDQLTTGHDPHKWAVGHTTFEFSFSLPEPANPGNCSKTKKKQPGPPPRKSTASTRPGEAPPKARKLKPHTKPDSASVETKKQERAEYERQRNQTPERKERARLLAQARQRKAKELGKCRNCIRPAIPGQTRCETCADHHRQSRRRSDAKRRDIAEPTPTTEK